MFDIFFKNPTIDDLIILLSKYDFKEKKALSLLSKIEDLNITDDKNQNIIHKIVLKGNVRAIRWLHENDAKIDLPDYDGKTPLRLAVSKSFSDMVDLLIKLDANIDSLDNKNRSILQDCVKIGNLRLYERIKKLASNTANLDNQGRNLLFDAIEGGNPDIIEDILNDSSIDNSICDKNGDYIIHLEKAYTDLTICTILLHNKVDINKKDKDGNTLLHKTVKEIVKNDLTSKNEIYKVLSLLFKKNIDLTIRNNDNETAFDIALNYNNVQLVELFLKNYYDPNEANEKGETVLHRAVVKGNKYKDIISLLISFGADTNIKDYEGISLVEKLIDIILHFSANKKISPALRRLIPQKDDGFLGILEQIILTSEVNLKEFNSNGEPYFFDPAKYDKPELLKLLLSKGLSINQVDQNDLNVLYAVMNHYKDVTIKKQLQSFYSTLRTLVSLDVNINARDSYGGTCLHKAILDHDSMVVNILMGAGPNITATDNRGRTMFHNTIWKNKKKILRIILSYDKKLINIEDKFGVLPIHYAAFLGYTDLVIELIKLGSHVNTHSIKGEYIRDFLKRFYKNLDMHVENTPYPSDKIRVADFIENMKKEFHIS